MNPQRIKTILATIGYQRLPLATMDYFFSMKYCFLRNIVNYKSLNYNNLQKVANGSQR